MTPCICARPAVRVASTLATTADVTAEVMAACTCWRRTAWVELGMTASAAPPASPDAVAAEETAGAAPCRWSR
eukprot:4530543-Pyramimonas_sp.AAC.1